MNYATEYYDRIKAKVHELFEQKYLDSHNFSEDEVIKVIAQAIHDEASAATKKVDPKDHSVQPYCFEKIYAGRIEEIVRQCGGSI